MHKKGPAPSERAIRAEGNCLPNDSATSRKKSVKLAYCLRVPSQFERSTKYQKEY